MELTERVQTALQASVVFLDIIGYSKYVVAKQFDVKKRFNADIAAAVANIPSDGRLMLDTGDGAALCFFSTPIHAFDCVRTLIAQFTDRATLPDVGFEVRTGVNVGPVRVIRDMNGQLNVVGDAINDGQRIMSFADNRQVLASRAFRDAVRMASEQYATMFEYFGVRADKHGKEHVLYELRIGPAHSAPARVLTPNRSAERTPAHSVPNASALARSGRAPSGELGRPNATPFVTRRLTAGWVPGVLETVTTQLESYLGPAAPGLVQEAAIQSRDLDALYTMLASHLATEIDRAGFLAGKDAVLRVLAQRGSAWPINAPKISQVTPAGAVWTPSPELLDAIAAKLARYVGALAGVLVRRTARQATSESDLLLRLAADLESDEDQLRFLDEVRGGGASRRI
jgi:class 3 adenylate cyclase